MSKGLAIALDGIDSSGKTTMTALLEQHLWSKYGTNRVIRTQQPGHTPVGKELRRILKDPQFLIDPVTERILFCADNSVFINTVARPAVEAGQILVSDRWSFITDLIYGLASDRPLDFIDKLQSFVEPLKLDLYIVLQCPWSIAKTRKIKVAAQNFGVKPDDCRIEAKGDQFMAKVSEIYGKIEAQKIADLVVSVYSYRVPPALESMIWQRTKRIVTIDATADFDDVKRKIFCAVDDLLIDNNFQI